MGRKGGKKMEFHLTQPLRQEASGKKQGNLNAKTMCKLDHLKSIAEWAAVEASISPLGAFLGQRVAATTEALGLRNDPSLFLCERCETILQPGCNCTVRIEKNKSKGRNRRKKSNINTQNTVVYKCHFCSHRNLMRGTLRGYVKEICPPKAKPPPKPKSNLTKSIVEDHSGFSKITPIADGSKASTVLLPIAAGQDPETGTPATPVLLLDAKRRKRNRSSSKKASENSTAVDEDKGVQNSSKRKRKSWMSLKKIAESREHETVKKLSSLSIPFFI